MLVTESQLSLIHIYDENFIRERIPQEDLLGMIHYNTEVIDADRQGDVYKRQLLMRSGCTDFGITDIPFWVAQRRPI